MLLFNILFYKQIQQTEDSIENYITKFEEFKDNIEDNSIFIHICNSFFKSCTKLGSGAAIYYSNSKGQLFIEFSTFNNCYTYGSADNRYYGGAICAYYCDCVIYCVCSNGCYAQSTEGQFFRTELSNSNEDKLNFFISSSVCSTPIKGQSYYTVAHYYGKQYCTADNVSKNSVYGYSGIRFDKSVGTQFITYCSMNSNTASYCGCMHLCSCENKVVGYEITRCNIISNTQQSTTVEGIILCKEPTTIVECCILGNTNSRLFFAGAQITIIDSTIPKSFSTSGSYYVDTNEAETTSFINYIKFTGKEGLCEIGIESFLDLTPVYLSTTYRPGEEANIEKQSLRKNDVLIPSNMNEESEQQIMNYVRKRKIQSDNNTIRKAKAKLNANAKEEIAQSQSSLLSFCISVLKFFFSPILLFNFLIQNKK